MALRLEKHMAPDTAKEGREGPAEGTASAKSSGQKEAWGVGQQERRWGWPELRINE